MTRGHLRVGMWWLLVVGLLDWVVEVVIAVSTPAAEPGTAVWHYCEALGYHGVAVFAFAFVLWLLSHLEWVEE